jgi:hypothetical protein
LIQLPLEEGRFGAYSQPWPNDEIRIVDRSSKSTSIIGSDGRVF